MEPDEFNGPAEPSRRGGRFEVFFYERVGNLYYLRFTRLALVLVLCLTVIPAAAIFTLFFTQSRADLDNVNVNIRVAPREPSNYPRQLIQPPPPPPTLHTSPKAGRSPRGGEPARQTPATPRLNTNTPPTPSPTPSPSPPRPPG